MESRQISSWAWWITGKYPLWKIYEKRNGNLRKKDNFFQKGCIFITVIGNSLKLCKSIRVFCNGSAEMVRMVRGIDNRKYQPTGDFSLQDECKSRMGTMTSLKECPMGISGSFLCWEIGAHCLTFRSTCLVNTLCKGIYIP